MNLTLVDAKNMKTLEDYAIALVTGLLTLKTLESFQIRSVELGILKEDQACRTNTIVWDIRRMLKLYQDQTESILELLPDDFNANAIIEGLKKNQVTKARSLTRKSKKEIAP